MNLSLSKSWFTFFVCSILTVIPISCSPLREVKTDDLNSELVPWKQCPRYGTFAGHADHDHDCCVRRGKCAMNATDIDSDLEQLVFRTKRAAGEDEPQMLVVRKQDSQSRWEISLCETRREVLKPVFGSPNDSNEQVQILQIVPVFEQRAVLENCVTGPSLLVNGVCRQHYKLEEFFTLTVGPGGKVIVKRQGLLVAAGCNLVVDMSPLRTALELEFSRPLDRPQYSLAPSETRIETVSVPLPVNSLTPLEQEYEVDDSYFDEDEKESQNNVEDDTSGSSSFDPGSTAGTQSQHNHPHTQGSTTGITFDVNRTPYLDAAANHLEINRFHGQPRLPTHEQNHESSTKLYDAPGEPKLPNTENYSITTGDRNNGIELAEIEPNNRLIAASNGTTGHGHSTHSTTEKDRLTISSEYQPGEPDPTLEGGPGFGDAGLNSILYETKPTEESAAVPHGHLSHEQSTHRQAEDLPRLSDKVGLPVFFPNAEYDPVKNLTGN